MDFYYTSLSAQCRSVMLTAKAVNVTLNKKVLGIRRKKFISINPQQSVPTLVDGDVKLWESRAICTYLASRYGKEDSLYPKDPKVRAEVDKLLYFDMGTLHQRFGDYVVSGRMS
ncbi:UNVERIFIED_CONTAM: hypothetical protein GTU68_058074 [Idotea baltica]|nr:hypothetical protein [Idotea baltica]